MDMFIICCVPAQIQYLEKILFLRFRPKCSQPVKLHEFRLTISPQQIERIWSLDSKVYCIWRINWFLACWYKFMQIKRKLKILGVRMVKNGCGQSCDGTLKLALCEEWMNGINWIFACWCRFITIKSWPKNYWVGIVKNGCDQSAHGNLKLTVSRNWIDEITWSFAFWYKCRKAESWFNDLWVGLVKNSSGFLVHETLKPVS